MDGIRPCSEFNAERQFIGSCMKFRFIQPALHLLKLFIHDLDLVFQFLNLGIGERGCRRKDGKQWRIGINLPDPAAAADHVYRAIPLEDTALATSGDYRNFFEINGRRYSHLIDPRTGYPVSNGVISATVLAADCTLADGLATAVVVMGHERGLALVDSLEGVEALIVVRHRDGTLADYYSSGLKSP